MMYVIRFHTHIHIFQNTTVTHARNHFQNILHTAGTSVTIAK